MNNRVLLGMCASLFLSLGASEQLIILEAPQGNAVYCLACNDGVFQDVQQHERDADVTEKEGLALAEALETAEDGEYEELLKRCNKLTACHAKHRAAYEKAVEKREAYLEQVKAMLTAASKNPLVSFLLECPREASYELRLDYMLGSLKDHLDESEVLYENIEVRNISRDACCLLSLPDLSVLEQMKDSPEGTQGVYDWFTKEVTFAATLEDMQDIYKRLEMFQDVMNGERNHYAILIAQAKARLSALKNLLRECGIKGDQSIYSYLKSLDEDQRHGIKWLTKAMDETAAYLMAIFLLDSILEGSKLPSPQSSPVMDSRRLESYPATEDSDDLPEGIEQLIQEVTALSPGELARRGISLPRRTSSRRGSRKGSRRASRKIAPVEEPSEESITNEELSSEFQALKGVDGEESKPLKIFLSTRKRDSLSARKSTRRNSLSKKSSWRDSRSQKKSSSRRESRKMSIPSKSEERPPMPIRKPTRLKGPPPAYQAPKPPKTLVVVAQTCHITQVIVLLKDFRFVVLKTCGTPGTLLDPTHFEELPG